ncbi:MAG: peptidase M61 [Flammeovirgaceae bacterium]|nr:peptidase M61 [Flammeovirgaceae bacterium]|tara:strand:- start:3872 stop:5710 length:1839 start_codon:yes stop_codon:yes gene_type:complete
MKIIFFVFASIQIFYTVAQDSYRINLNLTDSKKDRLKVVINLPDIQEDTVEFHLPKIVPGTYRISDFGRFIHKFDAFNHLGDPLAISKISVNKWLILGKPSRVEYWIDDTFDRMKGYDENFIFEPGGTSFEAERNVFVLNNFGIIGYIDGYKNIPFELRILHSKDTFGATALEKNILNDTLDLYFAANYHFLVDGPIMYNQPDTLTKNIAGAEILISVFSPQKVVSAHEIMGNIEDLIVAQSNYLGGILPVKKYAYLIYLMDYQSLSKGMGALEHSYSSFYTLPESVADQLPQFVRDVAAHEFFHIITPLGIHSEQIHNFNYINPEMSQHLWLYEGVTEYNSINMQVQQGLYDSETFLKEIAEKITNASAYPLVSFTQMSQKILDPEFKDMYRNVYEKGALIGMCLDLALIKYSEGKLNLIGLLKQLSQKYGKENAFKDSEFIDVITTMTYPEVGAFFSRYVQGNEPLPVEKYLSYAGISVREGGEKRLAYWGNFKLGLNENNQIIALDTDHLDAFGTQIGFKENDVFYKLNGNELNLSTWRNLLLDFQENTIDGSKVKIELIREIKGKTKIIKRKAKAETYQYKYPNELIISNESDPQENKLRSFWINGLN